MNNYFEALNLELPDTSEQDRMRNSVLRETPWAPTPTTNVSYSGANRLLVIGDLEQAQKIEQRLPEKILCYFACPGESNRESTVTNAYQCSSLLVEGYLGCYAVHVKSDSEEGETDQQDDRDENTNLASLFNIRNGLFDQILDCGETPAISAAIKPPGYYYAGEDANALSEACDLIPEMMGEFEKPKYFQYNADICAHNRSGVEGCRKCLDSCPADAIISIGETIEVNPHLCQGGGACASSCPTGAIEYTYPRASEQIDALRTIVRSMRQIFADSQLDLLIFDSENGHDEVSARVSELNGFAIPFMVEEMGSVGLDLISSALAYGANRVFLLLPEYIPAQARKTLELNVQLVHSVLEQTNCHTHSAIIINSLDDMHEPVERAQIDEVARFAPAGDKRNTIRAALGHFNTLSATPRTHADLPDGALFGRILLDSETCTLCMGCVSQCPGKALQAGGDTPALKFIEANCVQCGICAASCPESSISLQPRLHFDYNVVSKLQTLKEEAPFHCISCGKAFATNAMIKTITDKLKDHWMFDNTDALNRLRMCEDCRVVDLFDKEN